MVYKSGNSIKFTSINDGDVVIVDHDLENEETQITDTPEKPTRKT